MERNIQPREYGWTDSSDSNIIDDLFEEELEPDLLSNEDDEVPFARHKPIVEPNPEDVAAQRGFWNFYAIGFILDHRHTRGQCTHAMDDIELMLYRQRMRIQELHHTQYRFDGLQPQFTNELRAFHNRRRWTTQRPPWQPPPDSNLQWTWIDDNGPFITNGQCSNPQFPDSDFESDTTAIMFNLDSLNETKPESTQNLGWEKGCIPESPTPIH
ncbi:hypothetical protein SO802_006697 [Lithocarpus litseifolius]|uniref:Uncharacterized protein n=1 Tax=Lithocarpus litseifolius TaxID=425828 RepID=A0AAW2DQ43_9ROSI